MSDDWTERLIALLRNEPEANDANEVQTPQVDNGPPLSFRHGDSDSPDLSPVDYDDGTGEWRELDELRGYTVEEIQRIMQDVYEEYMDQSDRDESELNSGAAAGDNHLASLPSEVESDGGIELQQPQSESPTDEAQSDQTGSLADSIPKDTHTESSGAGQADLASGRDDASVPENGRSTGQATVDNRSTDEHERREAGSVPELVVTDYDNDESSAPRESAHLNLATSLLMIDIDYPTDDVSDIDSLPGLERMSGSRSHFLDFHHEEQNDNRNDVEDLEATLVNGHGIGLFSETELRQVEDEADLSETLVNETDSDGDVGPIGDHQIEISESLHPRYVVQHSNPQDHRDVDSVDASYNDPDTIVNALLGMVLVDPFSSAISTIEEASDEEGYCDTLFDAYEEAVGQESVGALGIMPPAWAREVEVMPGYEAFTDAPGPDDFDSEDDGAGALPSEHGRLGNQGDEEDIPWDARPTSFSNLESYVRDECPNVPLSPVPDVFHDLATASGDVEIIDYAELLRAYSNRIETEEVSSMLEWFRPADEVLSEHEWCDIDLTFTDMTALYDAQTYGY